MTKGCLGGLIGSPGDPGDEHEPPSEEGGDVVVVVGPRIRPSERKPERCGPEEEAVVTISYSIAILLLLLLSFVCGDAVVSSSISLSLYDDGCCMS